MFSTKHVNGIIYICPSINFIKFAPEQKVLFDECLSTSFGIPVVGTFEVQMQLNDLTKWVIAVILIITKFIIVTLTIR